MNTPLSTALHPLTFEMARRLSGPEGRARQTQQWYHIHGADSTPLPSRLTDEHPLVASVRLQRELDSCAAELVAVVKARLPQAYSTMQAWPDLPLPDVLLADLAIVADPKAEDGWALRWVECQAFPTVVSAMYTLHLAARELWPEVEGLAPWQLPTGEQDWLSASRKWSAPAGGILLEHEPRKQNSWYDLGLAAKFFGLDVVDPRQLLRQGETLAYKAEDGRLKEIHHVFNRLVMHELADRAGFEKTVSGADTSWHSHPAWYYGISKGWLPYLSHGPDAQCTTGLDWRSLGVPASELVAKNANSHGGTAVHLHVDEALLDSLPDPASWVVQPRYRQQPLFAATDGQPVFGEIRCVIALPAQGDPWSVFQRVRLLRGEKASAACIQEAPGSGAAVLYRPPGL